MDEAFEKKFKADKAAWKFFQAQIASYRKRASWWVMTAKQEATRHKRLDKLIKESAQGRTL